MTAPGVVTGMSLTCLRGTPSRTPVLCASGKPARVEEVVKGLRMLLFHKSVG